MEQKQPAIPMKGVAFPPGLFRALYRTINCRTTWHPCYENGLQLELWGKCSGDITPCCRFKHFFSKSYQSMMQYLWGFDPTCYEVVMLQTLSALKPLC